MAAKVITKRIQNNLDNFINNNKMEVLASQDEFIDLPKTKKVKKQDGLIERINDKIILSDDNRQLLGD